MRKSIILMGVCIAGGVVLYFFRGDIFGEKQIHYHANFLVSIRGVPFDFSSGKYMQRTEKCYLTDTKSPEERAHLHDGNGGLVHVHDAGVTWGDFFTNLHWTIGSEIISTDTGAIFAHDGKNRIRFILNSVEVPSPMGLIIQSRDRLLIDYSNDNTSSLLGRFAGVPADAEKANQSPDPASCGGGT